MKVQVIERTSVSRLGRLSLDILYRSSGPLTFAVVLRKEGEPDGDGAVIEEGNSLRKIVDGRDQACLIAHTFYHDADTDAAYIDILEEIELSR